jgi:hypothetical protein
MTADVRRSWFSVRRFERRTENVERRTIPVCRDDRGDERKPAPGERLNETWIVGRVPEGGAQLADAVGEPAIEVHVRVGTPEMRAHLLARHQIAGSRQQQRERPRWLRLQRDGTIRSREDPCPIVELEEPESVCHVTGR